MYVYMDVCECMCIWSFGFLCVYMCAYVCVCVFVCVVCVCVVCARARVFVEKQGAGKWYGFRSLPVLSIVVQRSLFILGIVESSSVWCAAYGVVDRNDVRTYQNNPRHGKYDLFVHGLREEENRHFMHWGGCPLEKKREFLEKSVLAKTTFQKPEKPRKH